MSTQVIAFQGFQVAVPTAWEVRITRGQWKSGYLVCIDHHLPTLNLTWQRSPRSLDPGRTLAGIDLRMAKEAKARRMRSDDLPGKTGVIARYTGEFGDFHAAVVRPDPQRDGSFVLRQLIPGTEDDLKAIAASLVCHRDEDPVPWRIHGLAVDLPAWWRLFTLENAVGLTRGVWFHHPGGRLHRTAAVLVLRRYALASRLLAGKALDEWIVSRVDRHEAITDRVLDADGTARVTCSAPGSTWWRRIRRKREIRQFAGWLEDAHDRMVVQEWKGLTDPLPVQRHPRDLRT